MNFVLFFTFFREGTFYTKAGHGTMAVLAIVIMCLVLWSGWFPREKFNAIWYLQAQTLAYICTLIFALTVVLRHAESISFKINFQFFQDSFCDKFAI